MSTIAFIFLGLAMLAVLGVLIAGVFFMAKGGEANKKYSNKLMQARVYIQGLALLILVIIGIMAAASGQDRKSVV